MIVIGSKYEHDCLWRYIDISISTIEELENQLIKYSSLNEEIYVCWMMTNNMVGTIFDIKTIGKLCHRYNAYYICDATASIGHMNLLRNLEEVCDCIFASAHKFQGEKGEGFMWLSDKICKHLNLSNSSKDNYGFRWGTEDVAGALMLADAFEDANQNIENKEMTWKMLSDILLRDLNNAGIECCYVADDKPRTHAINALQFKNFNGDAIATWLASNNIYVGVGHSACADNADYRVLEAFGLTPEEASRVIRVSFSEQNTIKDIKCLVESIIEFRDKFV